MMYNSILNGELDPFSLGKEIVIEQESPQESPQEEQRYRGVVRKSNSDKGYGFIFCEDAPNQDESQKDIFVHYSDIDMPGYKTLAEHQTVEFEISRGDKGPKAVKVRAI